MLGGFEAGGEVLVVGDAGKLGHCVEALQGAVVEDDLFFELGDLPAWGFAPLLLRGWWRRGVAFLCLGRLTEFKVRPVVFAGEHSVTSDAPADHLKVYGGAGDLEALHTRVALRDALALELIDSCLGGVHGILAGGQDVIVGAGHVFGK